MTNRSVDQMQETISGRLARQVIASKSVAPPADVIHAVERILLDSMGCALGAVSSPAVVGLRRWASQMSGTPGATLWGTGVASSVPGAALVNCTMTRDLDMNDTYFSHNPAHSSDNIGACIAVGEAQNASSAEIIKSILIAFEVQMRICEFTRRSVFKTAGWDQTTFITLAATAAAGALLNLNEEELVNAFGIAGSYPALGEMRVGQITMMKSASAGLAATRGLEAAYMAREGVTGPRPIFEGQRSLGKLVLGDCDWDVLTAPMGDWRLPRTCLKRYPAAYIIHSSIDATLALRAENRIDPRGVAEVTVDAFGWLIEDMVNGMGGISRYEIDARETADHSLPYCVAVSLVDGRYDIEQLRTNRWEAPEVRQMIAKTRCVHDKAMDARFPPDRPSRVTVRMNDGRTFVKELPYPKGDYRSPFSDDELSAKFRSLSAGLLTPRQQERAIACALGFSRESVGSLIRACNPQVP